MNAEKMTKPEAVDLYAMPPIAGSEKLPAAVFEAERSWEKAEQDAKKGQWLIAATKFMSAAQLLKLPEGSFYADHAQGARVFAYENAAICFVQASAAEVGRRRFIEALAADPACSKELNAILARLPGPKN